MSQSNSPRNDRNLPSSDTLPTGVRTSCDIVLLWVGVTVKIPCLVAVPPNVAIKLATKRSKSSELGHATYWCEDQLRHRAALGRSHCEDSLLGRCAAKCRNQTRHETIEIFRARTRYLLV